MKRFSLLLLALLGMVGFGYYGKSPTASSVRADPPAAIEAGQIQGGFTHAFQGELKALGQISTGEFAKRFPSSATYLDAFPWNPTTAQYYDHLQLDPNDPKAEIRARGQHAQFLRQQLEQLARQKGEDPKLVPREPKVTAKGQFDFRLNADELAKFKKNGFVVSERMGASNFIEMYYRIYARDLPVFVSADAILHAWHHSYDAMLEDLETHYLHASLQQIMGAMHGAIPDVHKEYGQGILQESVKDADYFLAVGISLLHGNGASWPTRLNQDERVQKTLKACNELRMQEFSLFGRDRKVDFSQFKVRGHYEKSETLQRYFKAMMWLGRTDLRVAGYPGNTSPRELGAALVLHDLLQRSKQFQAWQDFDATIQTFVGKTDSMTFAQLGEVLKENKIHSPTQMKSDENLADLQTAILAGKAGLQEIRGDIFQAGEPLPRSFTFLGQKFVVDSWALNKLVFEDIVWDGRLVKRKIPSCLDVGFAVFGNNQVVPQLVERIENRNGHLLRDGLPYQHNLAAVRNVIDRLPDSYWEENLYTHWLGSLRELSKPTTDAKNPQVMQTRAWAMKSLNTTMASWTEYLSGLTNLETLTLRGCPITDAGLKHFAGLTRLQVLNLADDKVTGSGFNHLIGLKNLKELRLDGNPVTSDAVAQLQQLPSLRSVDLTGTNVDDTAVLALKKKFPDADIRDVLGSEARLQPPPPPKKHQDLSKSVAAFKVTPDEFTKDYEKSSKAFEEKYGGKIVELTGVVKWHGTGDFGEPFVTLECAYVLGCACETVDREPWAKVMPGQKITLKGRWPGSAYGPCLHDCLFVDAPANQAITLPMDQLLKEYAANAEATVKKYEKKHLIVSGEVEAHKIDRSGNATLHLKGDGKLHVVCGFGFIYRDKTFIKSVRPGQQVTMVGELQTSYTPGEISLRECLPITIKQ